MVNGVPSAAFSMSLVTPMGQPNPQLRDALKKLSAAKYGRPRAQVEQEIFARLGAGDVAKKARLDSVQKTQQDRINRISSQGQTSDHQIGNEPSFLDKWLIKRQQLVAAIPEKTKQIEPLPQNDKLNIRERGSNEEISIRLR